MLHLRLVYGSEAWCLDEKACAILNGANSKMMDRITGKTIRDEASKATRTFDVVSWIRARRLQWVGHILRQEADRRENSPDAQPRLIYSAIVFMYDNEKKGDLLQDIPAHKNWEELITQAKDRARWRRLVKALKQDPLKSPKAPSVCIKISDKAPGWTPQRCFKFATTIFDKKKTTKTLTPNSRAAKRYRERDARAMFFNAPGKRRRVLRK